MIFHSYVKLPEGTTFTISHPFFLDLQSQTARFSCKSLKPLGSVLQTLFCRCFFDLSHLRANPESLHISKPTFPITKSVPHFWPVSSPLVILIHHHHGSGIGKALHWVPFEAPHMTQGQGGPQASAPTIAALVARRHGPIPVIYQGTTLHTVHGVDATVAWRGCKGQQGGEE